MTVIDNRPGKGGAQGGVSEAEFDSLFKSLFIDETELSNVRPPENEVADKNFFVPTPLQDDNRYVAAFGGNFVTFMDCRNPYSINEIKEIFINPAPGAFGQPQAITSIGEYVYVVTTNGKVHTIDWTDRGDPIVVNEVTILSGQHYDLASNGVDTLFIANTTNDAFIAVDVSNPLSPSLINSVNLGSFGAGVAYYDGYAYCAAFGGSIETFEFNGSIWASVDSEPSVPNTSRLAVGVNSIGDVSLIAQQYGTANFGIHSLSNPASPGSVGTLTAPENVNIYARAFISDGLLHLSTENGRLLAYDIADPLDTELVGTFEPKDELGNQLFQTGIGITRFPTEGAAFGGKNFMMMVGQYVGGGSGDRNIVVIPLPLFPDAVKAASLAEVGGAWKVNRIPISALDITNGYVTLTHVPRSEQKVMVVVAEGVTLVESQDYTVDKNNRQLIFEPGTLTLITEVFNLYGKVTVQASYFAQP